MGGVLSQEVLSKGREGVGETPDLYPDVTDLGLDLKSSILNSSRLLEESAVVDFEEVGVPFVLPRGVPTGVEVFRCVKESPMEDVLTLLCCLFPMLNIHFQRKLICRKLDIIVTMITLTTKGRGQPIIPIA